MVQHPSRQHTRLHHEGRSSAVPASHGPRALPRALRAVGTAVFLGAVLAAAGALGGCYQAASGDPDANAGAPAAETSDEAAATDGPAGGERDPDLPGDIPPALDDSGPPAADGRTPEGGRGSSEASVPGAGADDRVERRGETAFAGAGSRGQYLTEQVAMCVQCHSPKDALGRVDPRHKFEGGVIPIESPYAGREWAIEAPALAGLDFYDREELVRLLTEGIARDGEPPRPPMPPFRMQAADAEAIYDYLSSLPRER